MADPKNELTGKSLGQFRVILFPIYLSTKALHLWYDDGHKKTRGIPGIMALSRRIRKRHSALPGNNIG